MKKLKNETVYLIIIFVLVVLIAIFLIRAYVHYVNLRIHRNYLRQPNAKIESWMSIHTVIRDFNLSNETILFRELQINNSFANQRLTLDILCKKNHLNCSQVVDSLNALRQK